MARGDAIATPRAEGSPDSRATPRRPRPRAPTRGPRAHAPHRARAAPRRMPRGARARAESARVARSFRRREARRPPERSRGELAHRHELCTTRLERRDHVAQTAQRDVAGPEAAVQAQLLAPEIDKLPRMHEEHDGVAQTRQPRVA